MFEEFPDVPNPVLPGVPDFEMPEIDWDIPGVRVPQHVINGYAGLGNRFHDLLGRADTNFVAGPAMEQICIENPIKEFYGVKLPEYKACLNFAEVAQQAWVSPLRMALLFMLVWIFFSGVIVVLRQY